MTEFAPTVTLVAGGITFVNQWYWTHNLDWKVPVATVILAAGMSGLGKLDTKAANILSLMVLMGASTTKFNGHSAIDTVTTLTASRKTAPPKGTVSKVSNQ